MSVAEFVPWHRPGCSERCTPRWHDLDGHEAYGAHMERERQRVVVVRTGSLVIDLEDRRVTRSGDHVAVSPREWDVLACLAQKVGHYVSLNALRRAVWPEGHYSHSLARATVLRLRDRLGSAGDLIERTQYVAGSHSGWYRLRMVEPT